ncbi:MAG: hypothetical protein LBU05_00450 [Bifidobacteriaceae bacterium]|jgi:hypothetical protein|nr:hypothetical protein [Bifidobacteriaceae bacterium]
MKLNGGGPPADLMARAHSALLDALEALADQRQAVILIGAQPVYLHTGSAGSALAEATKDSDLALDPRELHDLPRLGQAMANAGFSATPSRSAISARVRPLTRRRPITLAEALSAAWRCATLEARNAARPYGLP